MTPQEIQEKLQELKGERKGLAQDLSLVDRQIDYLTTLRIQKCPHSNTKKITKSWTDCSYGQGLDREVYYYAHVCQDCGKEVSTEERPW